MVDFGFRNTFEPVKDLFRAGEWPGKNITPMDLAYAEVNLYPGVMHFQLIVDSAIRHVATDTT